MGQCGVGVAQSGEQACHLRFALRTVEAAHHGKRVAARSLDEQPLLWAAVAAAAGGYALAWLIHGRRG